MNTLRLGVCAVAGFSVVLLAAHPWEQPRTPNVSAGQKASDCGVCHTEIYAEWKQSTHAQAWTDVQFQAELHKDPAVGWMCLNCHTPVANQQAYFVNSAASIRDKAKIRNPAFDPDWQSEGVTCLSCHWTRDGIASVHEDVKAPHPTVYSPELKSDALCNECHQAVARIEDDLVCNFNTGQEKLDAGVTESCQDCHMPSVERVMALGGPVRKGGRHMWSGSGIPKSSEPTHAGLDGLDVQVTVPTQAKPGESVPVAITLVNARAGHMIPSGDPERYILVRIEGAEGLTEEWKIGQVWEWHPVSRKLSDNRLKPKETRTHEWAFTMPTQSVALNITVDHVRMSDENLQYHIKKAEKGHAGPSAAELKAYPTQRRLFDKQSQVMVVE